jgi:ketosteroid isomerase-like protein
VSDENVAVVRRAYEAWNQRDIDSIIGVLDPDVDWSFEGGTRFPGTDPSYRGHAGFREFSRIFIEPWREISIEIEETRVCGDAVVLFVLFRGRAREGPEVESPFAHVLWMRDRKVIRFRSYDREEALEAAGLKK